MTPEKLFFTRLRSEWKLNYTAWRPVIDWTVALYIIIPGVIIAVICYLRLWSQLPPWAADISIYTPLLLIFLYSWTGTIRLFLEEADQLFLLQRREWMRRIMICGIIYSAVCTLLTTLLLITILAPFLYLGYGLSIRQLTLLLVITFLFKMNIGLVKQFISLRLASWIEKITFIILFISTQLLFIKVVPLLIDHFLLGYTCCILLGLSLLLLIKLRLDIKGAFFDDIARENSERLKYAAFMLETSGVTIKKPSTKRKKPVFYSRIKRLFNERTTANTLVEVCIKTFLRSINNLSIYMVLVLLGILYMNNPNWSVLIIWPFLAFSFAMLIKSHYVEVITSDYLKLFQWKSEDKKTAARKSILILSTPGFLLISSVLGFSLFKWIGLFAILPVGVGVNYYIAKLSY
jgi:ABC-2 type transport system permease protein